MATPLQLISSLLAALVALALAAWVLLRGARSASTRIMALLLLCVGEWNGFEFLYLRHRVPTYINLEFIGVQLGPCLLFHYAVSLARPSAHRRWALAIVYFGTALFMTVALGGVLKIDGMWNLFWEASYHYNTWYLAFYTPFAVWAIGLLAWCRQGAKDPDVRSLFTYPLVAGAVIVPLAFLEMAIPEGLNVPRLASLGGLIGSVILAVGVVRHRTVYDAFALLRRDSANVLRAAVSGILFVEPDGRVVFSNGMARELLGLSSSPKTLAEAGLSVPEGDRAVIRSHGRVLEVRATKSADIFPVGRLSIILQDKTRDYALLEELASKDALASLGQASATLAHEIRNPLTAIQSAVDCIAQDAESGRAPEPRHSELIHGEVRRLSDLLERSLQLSRPLELHREPCDLNDLLRRTIGRMPPLNGHRILQDLASSLPAVPADPDLLFQLFANLLRNGVEASDDVRVSTLRAEGRTIVRVFSAGARIPPEVESRLFQPFVTSKARGTGLGLSLCRKIAVAHDAEIDGRNVDGGVLFEVRFPS